MSLLRSLVLGTALSATLAVGQIVAAEQNYQLHKRFTTSPELTLKSIHVDDKQTTVVINMTLPTNNPDRHPYFEGIGVLPPGDKEAFYLVDSENAEIEYPLIGFEGIKKWPEDRLKPGQSRDFTLFFAPLRDETKVVDLIEGHQQLPEDFGDYWNLTDIELK